MTIPIDKDQIWLTRRVTKLLIKSYRKGIADDTIVRVFGELLQASQGSAKAVLTSLKELTAIPEDDDGSDPAYG